MTNDELALKRQRIGEINSGDSIKGHDRTACVHQCLGRRSSCPANYMASMMALKVGLGRMIPSAMVSSGR